MGLRGKFGETHTYKRIRGKMAMVSLPGSPDQLSETQKAIKDRFLRAVRYAKAQINDEKMLAEYVRGLRKRKTVLMS